jgi:mannose-1-phosphate guanylyltransferase/phosphomannomutase
VGRNAIVEGAICGRNCDIRSNAHVHEGVAIGDQVVLGAQSVIFPDVRIYPHKEVETGAELHESLIWESRAATRLFARDAVTGLVNVDLTPEVAVRLGASLGTTLKRGSCVVATRESGKAYRVIKRSVMSGLNSAGVTVVDLQTLPATVGRHWLNTQNLDAAFHVGESPLDPEAVQVSLFERPGTPLSGPMQKQVDTHFTRQEARRVPFEEVGSITYPARAAESYADSLLATLNAGAIRERHFRIAIDYGGSAASSVLPLVLGPLGVESVAAHPFASDSATRPLAYGETLAEARRLVAAVGADLAVVFDRAGERLSLVDEKGAEVAAEKALLLYLRLLVDAGRQGRVAVPVNVTSQVDWMVGDSLSVVRTQTSLPALANEAAQEGMIFAGATGGGFIFPRFLPAYDAMAALCNLLELLTPDTRPLSELVAELPRPTIVHREVHCSWSLKGTVMRVLNERFANANIDLLDGIKVFDDRGWMQVLPDPDEPLIHIYAEGGTDEQSAELEEEMRSLVTDVVEGQEIGALQGI